MEEKEIGSRKQVEGNKSFTAAESLRLQVWIFTDPSWKTSVWTIFSRPQYCRRRELRPGTKQEATGSLLTMPATVWAILLELYISLSSKGFSLLLTGFGRVYLNLSSPHGPIGSQETLLPTSWTGSKEFWLACVEYDRQRLRPKPFQILFKRASPFQTPFMASFLDGHVK